MIFSVFAFLSLCALCTAQTSSPIIGWSTNAGGIQQTYAFNASMPVPPNFSVFTDSPLLFFAAVGNQMFLDTYRTTNLFDLNSKTTTTLGYYGLYADGTREIYEQDLISYGSDHIAVYTTNPWAAYAFHYENINSRLANWGWNYWYNRVSSAAMCNNYVYIQTPNVIYQLDVSSGTVLDFYNTTNAAYNLTCNTITEGVILVNSSAVLTLTFRPLTIPFVKVLALRAFKPAAVSMGNTAFYAVANNSIVAISPLLPSCGTVTDGCIVWESPISTTRPQVAIDSNNGLLFVAGNRPGAQVPGFVSLNASTGAIIDKFVFPGESASQFALNSNGRFFAAQVGGNLVVVNYMAEGYFAKSESVFLGDDINWSQVQTTGSDSIVVGYNRTGCSGLSFQTRGNLQVLPACPTKYPPTPLWVILAIVFTVIVGIVLIVLLVVWACRRHQKRCNVSTAYLNGYPSQASVLLVDRSIEKGFPI